MSNLGKMAWYKGSWYQITNIRMVGDKFEYFLHNKGWIAKHLITFIRKQFED